MENKDNLLELINKCTLIIRKHIEKEWNITNPSFNKDKKNIDKNEILKIWNNNLTIIFLNNIYNVIGPTRFENKNLIDSAKIIIDYDKRNENAIMWFDDGMMLIYKVFCDELTKINNYKNQLLSIYPLPSITN